MTELADEAYVRRCQLCGKAIKKPFFYRGYTFCSEECRSSFISDLKRLD
ncbi:MAG: hypothetical protein HY619_04030 [Thaumarchaeota archaeon]|nr:hypothetical protein [Nitrososphaerota archaeon]